MKLQGVVFDWAGTIVDHGSRAPVAALQDVFAGAGVAVTVAEARLSMGIAKKDHIRCILELQRVTEEWRRKRGVAPAETDVETLYAEFVPKQTQCLGRFSGAIAGVPETFEGLRSRGVRIGSPPATRDRCSSFSLTAHANRASRRTAQFVPEMCREVAALRRGCAT